MDFKKLLRSLLFPHPAVLIVLLPPSIGLLVYSLVSLGSHSPVSYVAYVLSAYTLTVWCVRIPEIIGLVGRLREHRLVRRWLDDTRLRVNISLWSAVGLNTAYAVMQLGLGIYHRSFWFYSMAVYYACLAAMRFFLLRYSRGHEPGECLRSELVRYRACGWVFLVMNLALSLMIFFMVYFGRTFVHHEITTIALAAYTFTSLTLSVIGMVKFKKYNSPVWSATKAIGLASAAVSMITLESTMLTTFGDGSIGNLERRLLLGLSGGAVSVLIISMAVYMIAVGTRGLKEEKGRLENI